MKIKKILAFGASNSRHSINREFAHFAANQVETAEVTLLDLNDFEMPIYSIDREKESGIPTEAHAFRQQIEEADGIVISFAEHNGSYTVAYKNIYDWISRIDRNIWMDKPMLVLATSPGRGGGKTVRAVAMKSFAYINQSSVSGMSLPSFRHNYAEQEGITDPEYKALFEEQLSIFQAALSTSDHQSIPKAS